MLQDFTLRVSFLRMKLDEFRQAHGPDAVPPGELVTEWEDQFDALQCGEGEVARWKEAEAAMLERRAAHRPQPIKTTYAAPDTALYTGRVHKPAQLDIFGGAQFALDL